MTHPPAPSRSNAVGCPPPLRFPRHRGCCPPCPKKTPKTTCSGINSMLQSVLSRDPDKMAGIPHSRLAFENFATGFVVLLLFSGFLVPTSAFSPKKCYVFNCTARGRAFAFARTFLFVCLAGAAGGTWLQSALCLRAVADHAWGNHAAPLVAGSMDESCADESCMWRGGYACSPTRSRGCVGDWPKITHTNAPIHTPTRH